MNTVTTADRNRAIARAKSRALQQLVKNHKPEFDRLCREQYKEAGIKVTQHSKSKKAKEERAKRKIEALKAELKHAEALLANQSVTKPNEQELFALWKQSVGL